MRLETHHLIRGKRPFEVLRDELDELAAAHLFRADHRPEGTR
jgi:hypothetical protein